MPLQTVSVKHQVPQAYLHLLAVAAIVFAFVASEGALFELCRLIRFYAWCLPDHTATAQTP